MRIVERPTQGSLTRQTARKAPFRHRVAEKSDVYCVIRPDIADCRMIVPILLAPSFIGVLARQSVVTQDGK